MTEHVHVRQVNMNVNNTPRTQDVTEHVHVRQVNMNVNNTPPTQDVTEHMHVCVFKNVHDYWRGFPPAGINMLRISAKGPIRCLKLHFSLSNLQNKMHRTGVLTKL